MKYKFKTINYLDLDSFENNIYINIVHGIIFMDKNEKTNWLQLKFKNNIKENISELNIKISSFNILGELICIEDNDINDFIFKDLNVSPNSFFGQDLAICLNSTEVYSVNIFIDKIITNSGKEIRIFSEYFLKKFKKRKNLKNLKSIYMNKKNGKFILNIKKFSSKMKDNLKKSEVQKKITNIFIISIIFIFISIGGFYLSGYIYNDINYNMGIKYFDDRDYINSLKYFEKSKDFKDSNEKINMVNKEYNIQKSKEIYGGSLGIGYFHTVAMKKDNTTIWFGDESDDKANIVNWKNLKEVSAGEYFTIGLTNDGKVLQTGFNAKYSDDISKLEDIKHISSRYSHIAAIKNDNTVTGVGPNLSGQLDVSDWKDIVEISTGKSHTVGLKSDGTVVATGNNNYGQLDVSSWTNIIEISAGEYHTVGLKSDGTVLAVGTNTTGQLDVSSWKNIKSISAANYMTIGVDMDGNIHGAGFNTNDILNFERYPEMKNLVYVYANIYGLIAIRDDGVLFGTGFPVYNGDMSKISWTNIGR